MTSQRDLNRLAASLGRASAAIIPEATRVLKKGGQNIKDDTKSRISSHPSWKRLSSSVGYDMSRLGGRAGLRVDVGYDDRGQGELAGIYEFGSARRRPHPTLMPAFETEKPRFVAEMDKAVKRALGGLS